jgi:hypothetical protein
MAYGDAPLDQEQNIKTQERREVDMRAKRLVIPISHSHGMLSSLALQSPHDRFKCRQCANARERQREECEGDNKAERNVGKITTMDTDIVTSCLRRRGGNSLFKRAAQRLSNRKTA